MTKLHVAVALLAACLCCMAARTVRSLAPNPPPASASGDFAKLVDGYFALHFQYHPTMATAAGFHQYDPQLEDYSRAAVDGEAGQLKALEARLERVDAGRLPLQDRDDLALLESTIQSRLLDLESIAMWRKDPDLCTSGVTYSIYVIIKRNFAPAEARLRSVIARERQIPAALEAARRNLENPPRIYTEIALEQLPGAIEFFRKDVPPAFQPVRDAKLLKEFQAANAAVVSALEKYQAFVRDDLLPAARGDFRIAPEQLMHTFRDVLGSLRRFIEEKHIVTIPSQVSPIAEETPAFMRATTTASMDTPGPYETRATEALFHVTLPESDWAPGRVEEWMEAFNRGTIASTAIHEVYPGHYTQFLWARRFPSKVRKLVDVGTNVEGWAHYTEQMMLDEGYGGGDPRLRMGQLQDALLRDARFIVGIKMHTGQMSLAAAKEFFVREGYQVPPVAEVEAKRGTGDPTYLVYTLGKLQILKLRADYQKKEGAKFSLRDFHDRFLATGGIPLKLVRKEMLGEDGPTL
jgi:uncharacterized protein (DUF885 family)